MASDFLAFLDSSPSSFHAAYEVGRRLADSGFVQVAETAEFAVEPGGYFLISGGAIVAWRIPETLSEAPGFRIVGAHTDSPAFKLKPHPDVQSHGYQQVAVETYGGMLLNSWLDRELGLAGRLVTLSGREVLVRTGPWLRVPQLAIHLDRSANSALTLDPQRHLVPVIGLGFGALLPELSAVAGVDVKDVAGFDVYCYPTQPAAVFGIRDEFVAAARLDNLASVYPGLQALLAAEESGEVQVLACFDHEEIGSASTTGAAGPLLEHVLQRIAGVLGWVGEDWFRAVARSSCVSVDVSHAVHPNYPELHDSGHEPLLNAGPVLKVNAKQRYATDAVGEALWRRACAAAEVKTQVFVANNSSPCGSTIGPITATRLGILTVDVGSPVLSMHSAREMAGVADVALMERVLTAYYSGA